MDKNTFIKTKLNIQKDKLASPLTCKLAKLCGFDWNMIETVKGAIMAFSQCWKEETPGDFVLINPKQYRSANPHIPAMSLDLLHRWVREICHYYVCPTIEYSEQIKWEAKIIDWNIKEFRISKVKNLEALSFAKYEDALERGLQQSLYDYYWRYIVKDKNKSIRDLNLSIENMIETIIKNKNVYKNQDVELKQE